MTQRSEAASVSVHVLSKQGNLGHVKGSAINTVPPLPLSAQFIQSNTNKSINDI